MDNLPDPYSLTETQLRSLYDSPGFRSLPVDYQDSVIRARYALGKRQRANLSSQYFAGKEAAQAADKEATQNLLKGFATPPVSPEEDREGRTGGILARTVFPYEGELFKDMYQGVPAPKETPAAAPAAAVKPPPAAPTASPFQDMIDKFFTSGRTQRAAPSIPRIDTKELEKKFPEIGEREKQEVYKADPYMAMLQTGLRILSAQPQVGQSGLSVIAAPIAKGVEEYQGEKEKERQSKREEAAASREDLYRRTEAAKSTAALGLQAATANQNAAYHEAQLRQQASQHGDTIGLKRIELLMNASERQAKASLEKAQEDYYRSRDPRVIIAYAAPLEDRLAEIQKKIQDKDTPAAERQQFQLEIPRIERDLSTLRGTLRSEITSGAGADRAMISGLFAQVKKGPGITPEEKSAYNEAMARLRELGYMQAIPNPNESLR